MDIQNLTREFRYNGVVLADPNQSFTLTQVRDFFANVYPEITSADIEGPEHAGAKAIYTFRRAVGTKGGTSARETALQRLRTGGRLAAGERPTHIVPAAHVSDPVARQLDRIIAQSRQQAAARCLAPAANHSVLP